MLEALLLLAMAVNPYLEEGRERYEALRYEQALGPLILALEVPGQTQLELREAFDLLARTRAALGDLAGTRATYVELLKRDPMAPLPTDAAPKIRDAFTAARRERYPAGTVRLARKPGTDGRVKVEVTDPWGVVVRVELRAVGGEPRAVAQGGGPVVELRAPPGLEQGWVAALDATGGVLATLGSAKAPLALAPPDREAPRPLAPTASRGDTARDSAPARVPPQDDAGRGTSQGLRSEPPGTGGAPRFPVMETAETVMAEKPTDAPRALALQPSIESPPPSSAPLLASTLTGASGVPWKTPLVVTGGVLAVTFAGIGVGLGLAARADARTIAGWPVGAVRGVSQRDAQALVEQQGTEASLANAAFASALGFAATSLLVSWLVPGEATRP
jgi:hypothetical protein